MNPIPLDAQYIGYWTQDQLCPRPQHSWFPVLFCYLKKDQPEQSCYTLLSANRKDAQTAHMDRNVGT